jgi:hypothetical protein
VPQVNVMYWNLGGVDQRRLARTGDSFARLIASVMRAGNISLAGFSGVLSGQGDALGRQVVGDLDRSSGGPSWNQQASAQLGQGRSEQYLFVWRLQDLSAYRPQGLDYWLWRYPVPNTQGQYLGFPRPESQSSDMPPFTMFFQLGSSGRWMPMAILNAPPWQSGQTSGQAIALALASVSQATAFDLGNGSLLMGTFNVPADDNVGASNSNGALAFGGLAGPRGKYNQVMNNQRTFLARTPGVAMTDQDAYVQTSDNFFLRRNSSQGGVAASAAAILDVIAASMGTLNDQGVWQAARFRPALAVVEAACTNNRGVTAGQDGSYDRFDDAFASYRLYVSDHMPIAITINF